MPRQRINYNRITYQFPGDFPQRLERFQKESGLSWAEIARRIGTYPHTLSPSGGPAQCRDSGLNTTE